MISFALGDIVSRCTGMTLRRYNYPSDNKVQTTNRSEKFGARERCLPLNAVANENGLGNEGSVWLGARANAA